MHKAKHHTCKTSALVLAELHRFSISFQPSNIFISTSGDLQIQLGDFGLACPLQRENHPSVLGTHMYAAPEQLQGKCDPKVLFHYSNLASILMPVLS